MVKDGHAYLHDPIDAAPLVGTGHFPALDVREGPAIRKGKVWTVFELSRVWHREVSQYGPASRKARKAFGPHRW